jgi:RNA recognition motif-containing protein
MAKKNKHTEKLSSSDEASNNNEASEAEQEVVAKPWAPSQLFVSGLPYEVTEDALKAFFGDAAKDIGHIKLPKYQDTGRCLGYAHVLFNTESGYQAALKLDR